jgi:hypothetical protein
MLTIPSATSGFAGGLTREDQIKDIEKEDVMNRG